MIDFAPIASMGLEVAFAVIGVAAAWVLSKVGKKFGVDVDEKMNERINEAVERGLAYANQRLVEGNKSLTKSTESEFVSETANYVIKGIPKALDHFGLDEDRVAELVRSRLSGKVPDDQPENTQEG